MSQIPCTRYSQSHINAQPFSNFNFNMLLADGTALSYTVPGLSTQKFKVRFQCSSTAEIWVNYGAAATDPSSNTATTNAYQELIPLNESRYVIGGTTLSFLAIAGTPRLSAQLLLVEDQTNQ